MTAWSSGPVRIGLIGLGWGERVAVAMRALAGVELAVCFARAPVVREAFARRFGCRPAESFDALLDDDRLDGVVLMTPNATHRELAIQAMKAGKHVLVTKPIATTLEDAMAMIRTARETGRILAVGHQSRRHPALRILKQFIDDGGLGPVRTIEGNTSSATGLRVTRGNWRSRMEECPGGPLLQLGIHYIDNFQYFFGPVERVTASFEKIGGGAVDPDTSTVLLRFDAGMAGYLGCSYVTPHTRWIRVSGEKATALFEADGSLVLHAASEMRVLLPAASDGSAVRRGVLAAEVEELAACIRTGEAPETGGRAGARNLAVVLAAVESHRRGVPVDVEALLRAAGL